MKTLKLLILFLSAGFVLTGQPSSGRGRGWMVSEVFAAQSDAEVSSALSGCMKAQPPAPPSSTGSAVSAANAQLALQFHNCARQEVGSPPLQWSTELSAYAQNWANHLAKDEHCNLVHSEGGDYGENLFGGSGSYTPLFASQDWYTEKKLFHYGVLNESNWAPSGHYTQMVWKATTNVGMGEAHCPGGDLVIVAEYSPAGNMMGEKPY